MYQKVLQDSSLLQAEQSQFSHPVFIGKVLQLPYDLHGSTLDFFIKSTSFLSWRSQIWMQWSRGSLKRAEQRDRITLLDLLVLLL